MISAERTIAQPPGRVFDFLSDLRNHWRLESRAFVEVLDDEPDPAGGRIRLKGPLGLSREARTSVVAAEPPEGGPPGRVSGIAEVGSASVGRVTWTLVPHEAGTSVRLSAAVERASRFDRLLLGLGGEIWLRRLFSRALANLETALQAAP